VGLLIGLLLIRFNWCSVSVDPNRFGLWSCIGFLHQLMTDFSCWGLWGCNQVVGGEVGVAFPVVVSTWPFREAVRAAWRHSYSDRTGPAVRPVKDRTRAYTGPVHLKDRLCN
jgi:hypothetical protein